MDKLHLYELIAATKQRSGMSPSGSFVDYNLHISSCSIRKKKSLSSVVFKQGILKSNFYIFVSLLSAFVCKLQIICAIRSPSCLSFFDKQMLRSNRE